MSNTYIRLLGGKTREKKPWYTCSQHSGHTCVPCFVWTIAVTSAKVKEEIKSDTCFPWRGDRCTDQVPFGMSTSTHALGFTSGVAALLHFYLLKPSTEELSSTAKGVLSSFSLLWSAENVSLGWVPAGQTRRCRKTQKGKLPPAQRQRQEWNAASWGASRENSAACGPN